MYANRRNFRVVKEIGVEEHDGDVRFKSGSGNTAALCMRNASGHNYMDFAMGQTPRSTELICSYYLSLQLWEGQTILSFHSSQKTFANINHFDYNRTNFKVKNCTRFRFGG